MQAHCNLILSLKLGKWSGGVGEWYQRGTQGSSKYLWFKKKKRREVYGWEKLWFGEARYWVYSRCVMFCMLETFHHYHIQKKPSLSPEVEQSLYQDLLVLSCAYWELWASLVAQTVKCLPRNAGDRVWSLGWEDPLEEEMAAHSSILAWRIPWTEEPGGLQSMGLQRDGHTTERLHFHFCCELWVHG